jgi:PAS domain S-box-containing protein
MSDERVLRQLAALNRLTRSDQLQTDDFLTALRRVTETAARTLEVERVSVWRFVGEGEGAVIRCLAQYELNPDRHSSGLELRVEDYPAYFRALATAEIVAADDVRRDERTRELSKNYLLPFNITSMIDAPIHLNGRVVGVLCHEHVGLLRKWMPEDKMFAVATANLVSALFGQWERKQAEAQGREQEARLQQALRSARVGAWDWDILTGQVTWSDGVEELFGMAPGSFKGSYQAYRDSIHAEDLALVSEAIRSALEEDRPYDIEHRVLWPDGEAHWLACKGNVQRDAAGRAIRMSGTVMCISARKWAEEALSESEEQLRQSQKMDAVGKLAGGIAHDFNNLLTIITGYSQLLLNRLEPQAPLRKDLEEIKKAGDRAAALTQQLLAFSRRQVLLPEVMDLNAIVAGMATMLQRILGEDIDLATALAEGLGPVRADPGQIEQVILNLAVNARDAMLHGGKLTIETLNVEVKESQRRGQSVVPGSYVMLSVSDTGHGMDAETQARIFEPFFTTKESGKGTGLGLSTVYGIVNQSGGYIFVYSEPGRGATFKIYLPRVDARVESSGEASQPAADLPSGTETILLVEDEPGVRFLVCDMLRQQGYAVLEARHGFEALVISAQHVGTIQLLITDVVMPQMSGREVADQLAATRPGLSVLYISGYTENAVVHHGVLDPGTFFLPKPFTAEVLLRKVREVLDSTRRHAS